MSSYFITIFFYIYASGTILTGNDSNKTEQALIKDTTIEDAVLIRVSKTQRRHLSTTRVLYDTGRWWIFGCTVKAVDKLQLVRVGRGGRLRRQG